ncbi:MAG: ABC transporter substrate-binding protein, partial [Saccharofermentanales bacterium]
AKIIATHIAKTANTAAFSQRVLILPQGAAEPKNVTWDKKIDGNIERAITMSSSHAGHFANLNAINVVKGTSIKADGCYIPSLKTALQNGSAVYVGSGSTTDKELVASLKPQVVFVGGMQSDIDLAAKLEESGIFCFYFGDFAENNYMGRGQWIELIGAFIGKEKMAQDFIRNSESQVNSILIRAAQIKEKPDVLWFTHNTQAPHWNIRTCYDYANSMIASLGGNLVFPPDAKASSIKLSNESFLEYMNKADKIIFGISLNSYKDARDITYFNKDGQVDFSTAPAFINDQCYVVGYDWAQDTADVAGIIGSLAICLYPDEFRDLRNSGKIIKFKVG